MNLPKVSVITVVYNDAGHIEKTLRSVLAQTYPNIEYIVVDGGSTDGTVNIIKRYESRISHWLSEPDEGIYDAMNRGLFIASGTWLIFMNSGDVFYSDSTLDDVFRSPITDVDIVYGAVEIQYADFNRIEWPGRLDRLWQGMVFSHQSAFVDVKYHRKHPFNTANRIAADLEFFYQAYLTGARFVNAGVIISRVSIGGISETKRIEAILASRHAVCGKRALPLVQLYYRWRVLDAKLREFAKRILPKVIVKWIILHK